MRLHFLMFITVFFLFCFCFFFYIACFILSVEGRVGEASDSGIIQAIKSRIIIQSRARCKFRALYDACYVANIPRGVLGTRQKEWIRIRVGYVWTGKFDLNPDTCGRGNFFNQERKSCGFKNIRKRVDEALKWQNQMIEKRVAESWEDIWSLLNFTLVEYPSKVESFIFWTMKTVYKSMNKRNAKQEEVKKERRLELWYPSYLYLSPRLIRFEI